MQLALFPLSSQLLPGGIMPLRIFEPRYQRMIIEAGETGFAICMVNPEQPDALRNMLPIATRVTIIDFDQLSDGTLGITVQGVERVAIDEVWQESDGLRVGQVMALAPWPTQPLSPDQLPLVEGLQGVFADSPDYAELYTAPCWDEGSWIAQRWLEVLPLPVEQKQSLLAAPDSQSALALIQGVLMASH
ncbi:MAG: LON peptidase substrate-binding domain-containing protein [Aeromonas sp.]